MNKRCTPRIAFPKNSAGFPCCLPASLLLAFWIGISTSPASALGSTPQQKPAPCSKTFQHTTSQASDDGPVSNVSLQQDGTLRGVVVDLQGIPVSQATVVVHHQGRTIAETKCDAAGCFTVPGLAGGVYQVISASGGGVFRLWNASIAPPSAGAGALIIARGDLLRGQIPHTERTASLTGSPSVLTPLR